MIERLISAIVDSGDRSISDERIVLSSSEFLIIVERYARMLRQAGVPERARVCFAIRNSTSHLALLLACWRERYIVFLVPPGVTPGQITFTAERLAAHIFLVDVPTAQLFDPALVRECGRCDDTAVLRTKQPAGALDLLESYADVGVMTSGSTGMPKAVLNSLERILLNAELHADAIGMESDDNIACFLPLHFSYGLVASALAGLLRGCSVSLARPDAARSAKMARDRRVTILSSTPYLSKKLLGSSIPSLRVLTVGGDLLDPAHACALSSHFDRAAIYATYGLTEAGPRVASSRLDLLDLSCRPSIPLGAPLAGVTLELGNEGELSVNTPTAMLGYFGEPQVSQQVLQSTDQVHTGDLFRRSYGELYFLGRKKRMIVRGGEKVSPALIESHLRMFEGVEDVWVESCADDQHGEVPAAYIVARRTIEERELGRFIRSALPGSHVPTRFAFVDELPVHVRRK